MNPERNFEYLQIQFFAGMLLTKTPISLETKVVYLTFTSKNKIVILSTVGRDSINLADLQIFNCNFVTNIVFSQTLFLN